MRFVRVNAQHVSLRRYQTGNFRHVRRNASRTCTGSSLPRSQLCGDGRRATRTCFYQMGHTPLPRKRLWRACSLVQSPRELRADSRFLCSARLLRRTKYTPVKATRIQPVSLSFLLGEAIQSVDAGYIPTDARPVATVTVMSVARRRQHARHPFPPN